MEVGATMCVDAFHMEGYIDLIRICLLLQEYRYGSWHFFVGGEWDTTLLLCLGNSKF